MTSLAAEIWMCLVVAALQGVAAGWLLWGRPAARIKAVNGRRLRRLRGNWEAVEEQLVNALARTAELEKALSHRLHPGAAQESTVAANAPDNGDGWKDERRLLEAAVRALDERVQSLEAAECAPQGAGTDGHPRRAPESVLSERSAARHRARSSP